MDQEGAINQLKSHLSSMVDLISKIESIDEEKEQAVKSSEDILLGRFPYRVIHFKQNPLQLEVNKREAEFKLLRVENERLKARLKLLEQGNKSDVTVRIDDVVKSDNQIKILTEKVEEMKRREAKIVDSFGKTSREFRQVSYMLTGWKMSAQKDGIYVMTNMYAEREQDKLVFQVDSDGTFQLLQNEYSDSLTDLVRTYLKNSDSFPAFLAALTLDLFKSTTMQNTMQESDMSVTMSTTVVPNENFNPIR